jgi:hypothetical protein
LCNLNSSINSCSANHEQKESDEIAGTMWLQCATSVILTRIECVAVRSCVSVSRNVATLCTKRQDSVNEEDANEGRLGHGWKWRDSKTDGQASSVYLDCVESAASILVFRSTRHCSAHCRTGLPMAHHTARSDVAAWQLLPVPCATESYSESNFFRSRMASLSHRWCATVKVSRIFVCA